MPRGPQSLWGFAGVVLLAHLGPAPVLAEPDAPPPALLQGVLRLDQAPPIAWQVSLFSAKTDQPATLRIEARAEGLELELSALPTDDGLRWRVIRGQIDLASWWPAARTRAGLTQSLAGWGVSGRVTLSGEGAWRDDRPSGWVELRWEGGGVFNDELGVDARDINVRLRCEDLVGFALAEGQRITVDTVTASGVTARDVTLEFSRAADGTLRIVGASLNVFGGALRMDPVTFNPASPHLQATVHFTDISFVELAGLVPTAVSGADGRLTGRGSVDWDFAHKLPGSAHLRVEHPEHASLRLAPKPGFLTSNMPRRFNFLPPSWGLIARLFSPVNPAYAPLQDIELGRVPLAVSAMDIKLTPDASGGRSARISLQTDPVNSAAIKSLSIDINVNGSLSEVISLGLDQRVRSASP